MTRYLVTGPTAYAGHQPGEEFTATLDPGAERRALERGNIEIVKKAKPKQEEESDA